MATRKRTQEPNQDLEPPVLMASEGRPRPTLESAEKILAAQARWREKSKDKIRTYQKTWRGKNREKVAAAHKKYQEAHKDKVKMWHKRSRLRQQEILRQAKEIVEQQAQQIAV